MRKCKVLFLVLICLFVSVSCNDSDSRARTSVTLRIEEGEDSRTIMPLAALMEVQKYSVTGKGPSGATFGPIVSTDSELSIKDIATGSWTISAKALNAQNNELASGEGAFNIKKGANNATVVLDKMLGTGSLELNFSWESGICSESKIRIFISLEDESGKKLEKTKEVLTSDLSTSVVLNLSAGSHLLNIQVQDSRGNLGVGATDAVRIVANTRSTGSVRLKSSSSSVSSSSGTSLKLENAVGSPMNFYIDYTPKNITSGKFMTLRALCSSLPSGVDEDDLHFQWYEDGVLMSPGDADNISMLAESGMHRFDVIVRSGKEGTMCGASLNLNVSD